MLPFPGTPILYYGDEIGMGDNIYLGDRNGVRTPMQWTGDRNAGFSRAVPAKLFSPPVMDPVWGYEAINVEAQQSDPSSLLSWMRNMIALRKLFRVFGRGSLKFLHPANRKVLAYVREDGDERVLCVANLSRFPQPAQLDLSEYAGLIPVEMLGYVEFPKIEKTPYPVTLNQYGFLWLELQGALEPEEEPEPPANAGLRLQHAADWKTVLSGGARERMEQEWLPAFLPKQRWFGGKSRQITATAIRDWGPMGDHALALVDITYAEGDKDTYFLPLAISIGALGDSIFKGHATAVLAAVATPEGSGYLHDAAFDDEAAREFLTLIGNTGELAMQRGTVRGMPGANFAELRGNEVPEPRRGSAEQSNTSILFGSRLILKLFRRQQFGPNPDTEIGRYLTEHTGFRAIPPFAGSLEYQSAATNESSTLAMLQGLVPNEGDGWEWTLEDLQRYFEQTSVLTLPEEHFPRASVSLTELSEHPESNWTRDHVGTYLDAAALLGRRTAEMHLALGRPTQDPAFSPEPMTEADLAALRANLAEHANMAFDALRQNLSHLPADVEEMSGLVLSRRRQVAERLGRVGDTSPSRLRTRVHGDYHLGQVLRTRGDFVILDFEGEPARSLNERREKQSPIKDVAGMLRSFSYAAYSGLMRVLVRRPGDADRLEPWARLWEQSVCSAFLRAYRLTMKAAGGGMVPAEAEVFEQLLEIYVLDKALYELAYELNNRPAWVRIPLAGILALPLR